jgi:hypothetical protein
VIPPAFRPASFTSPFPTTDHSSSQAIFDCIRSVLAIFLAPAFEQDRLVSQLSDLHCLNGSDSLWKELPRLLFPQQFFTFNTFSPLSPIILFHHLIAYLSPHRYPYISSTTMADNINFHEQPDINQYIDLRESWVERPATDGGYSHPEP